MGKVTGGSGDALSHDFDDGAAIGWSPGFDTGFGFGIGFSGDLEVSWSGSVNGPRLSASVTKSGAVQSLEVAVGTNGGYISSTAGTGAVVGVGLNVNVTTGLRSTVGYQHSTGLINEVHPVFEISLGAPVVGTVTYTASEPPDLGALNSEAVARRDKILSDLGQAVEARYFNPNSTRTYEYVTALAERRYDDAAGVLTDTQAGRAIFVNTTGNPLADWYPDKIIWDLASGLPNTVGETNRDRQGSDGRTGSDSRDVDTGSRSNTGAPGNQGGVSGAAQGRATGMAETGGTGYTGASSDPPSGRGNVGSSNADHLSRVNDGNRLGGVPVLLDLDGDGIEITALDKSTRFVDAGGQGLQHRTAWAGNGDGVLFIDADGNGALSNSHEYIFTEWDASADDDMAALRRAFDTNSDGKLTSADTRRGAFRVLVTKPDGSTEVKTLAQPGITEINLKADTTYIELPDGSMITGQAENPAQRQAHLIHL